MAMFRSDSQADDKLCSLQDIRSSQPNKSLISRLMDMQEYKIDQKKSLGFVKKLECLSLSPSKRSHDDQQKGPILLRRTEINAMERGDFTAVSYTWTPSPRFEYNAPSGGYHVQQRPSDKFEQDKFEPSPVRDRVLRRVLRYMEANGVKYLWIDQHCIEQKPGQKKETGIQAMDLVYSKSEHPAALLARPVGSSEELEWLVKILSGGLVQKSNGDLRLSRGTSREQAYRAVKLLKEITDDLWWERGWTFQENYRSNAKMTLLIPHPECLEHQKRKSSEALVGRLRDELCIDSLTFHEEATKICLAYEAQQPICPGMSESIVVRAPRYSIILRTQDMDGNASTPVSMSPKIISDISERKLGEKWDYLAIVANCCRYSVRLNSLKLRKVETSISLSMLCLYILNGEILSNDPRYTIDIERLKKKNIREYISLQSYQRLSSPFSDRALTFNKSCRFIQVEITQSGIRTTGHIWEIRRFLPARSFSSRKLPWEDPTQEGLCLDTRRHLRKLVQTLHKCREPFLAQELHRFLLEDLNTGSVSTFRMYWLRHMAKLIASAMKERKGLCIGKLVDDTGTYTTSGAIFVAEDLVEDDIGHESNSDGDNSADWNDSNGPEEQGPVYIFTSSQPEKSNENVHYNDLDHHVCMVVDCHDISKPVPQLFTKQWVHGLYFFDTWPRQDVLFPWPRSFGDL